MVLVPTLPSAYSLSLPPSLPQLYEVIVHSKAYAENEWRGAQPWSPPSSAILAAGATSEYGVRLRLAEDVESVTPALLAAQQPVVTPLPSATLHADMTDARLQVFTPPNAMVSIRAP